MKNINQKNVTMEVKAVEKNTSSMRFVSPDGLIFYSRKEYLEYMEGLR